MRVFLALWSALWTLGLPVVLLYLRRRARRDALYGRHLGERFGRHAPRAPGAVWIHAVSLGEMRSAVPLVRALLERGERVVTTHFTPAGRREAGRVFAPEIAAGRLAAVWVPFELAWCWRGFLRAYRPRLGLVMEIEIWPRMVMAARASGVPLYMCNAQYPLDSMARDRRLPLRPAVMRRFAGAFVKSSLQRERFLAVGVPNVTVTGELRFDQTIPPEQVAAARALRPALAGPRRVITLASVTAREEALFLEVIAQALAAPGSGPGSGSAPGSEPPFFVLVPRAPERFDPLAHELGARGLRSLRRSRTIGPGPGFGAVAELSGADVLLGDSLGEMQLYLALGDRAVVGGGFGGGGSHNIIEPLALGMPVLIGPDYGTIEYPAVEAIAAGLCLSLDAGALGPALAPGGWAGPSPGAIAAFLAEHSGATARMMAALEPLLHERPPASR